MVNIPRVDQIVDRCIDLYYSSISCIKLATLPCLATSGNTSDNTPDNGKATGTKGVVGNEVEEQETALITIRKRMGNSDPVTKGVTNLVTLLFPRCYRTVLQYECLQNGDIFGNDEIVELPGGAIRLHLKGKVIDYTQ